MKPGLKQQFLDLWKKYFGTAELPIVFFYTEGDGGADKAEKPAGRSCLICELAKIRKGKSLYFNIDSLGCMGAKRYLGYTDKLRPGFEYFLSCGNEKMEGERYIRTPEMVEVFMKNQITLPIDGKNIVFKRWDMLTERDNPRAVIGMFDPSARPCVPEDVLTFAVPLKRFVNMIGYMEESFLITKTWTILRKRMDNS